MSHKLFRVYKEEVKHKFVIDVTERDDYVDIKLDGNRAIFKDDHLEFSYPTTRKINGKSISGITISTEIAKYIGDMWARIMEKRAQEDRDMEADRKAPTLDETKFFTFSYGCDTGLIYPREYEAAIEKSIEEGAERVQVFRGSRDKNSKFPDTYDNLIPASYVTVKTDNDDGYGKYNTYSAPGYSSVWCETYALPLDVVQRNKKLIDEEKQKAKDMSKRLHEEKINELKSLAKSSGEKQVLRQWSDECDDPSEECDIDNIYEYIMPDGSVVVERYHTW